MIFVSVVGDCDVSEFSDTRYYTVAHTPYGEMPIQTRFAPPNVVGSIHAVTPTVEFTKFAELSRVINTLRGHYENSMRIIRDLHVNTTYSGVIAISRPELPKVGNGYMFDPGRVYTHSPDTNEHYPLEMDVPYDFFTSHPSTFLRLTQFSYTYPMYNPSRYWWGEYVYQMDAHRADIPFDHWVWKMACTAANVRTRRHYL